MGKVLPCGHITPNISPKSMQQVPESLFDKPSDEGEMLDIFSSSGFFGSQNPHHLCMDLLLYIRMLG